MSDNVDEREEEQPAGEPFDLSPISHDFITPSVRLKVAKSLLSASVEEGWPEWLTARFQRNVEKLQKEVAEKKLASSENLGPEDAPQALSDASPKLRSLNSALPDDSE